MSYKKYENFENEKPSKSIDPEEEIKRREKDHLDSKMKKIEESAQRDRQQIKEKWENLGRCGYCGSLDHTTKMHRVLERE